MNEKINNPSDWLIALINEYVAASPENDLKLQKKEKVFDKPLVGFSNGADELYTIYKNHIGSFYLTPAEMFEKTLPEHGCTPTELTVISWIIPSTKTTRKEQGSQDKFPSERWIRTRAYGEDFNNAIRRFVVRELPKKGVQAIAPLLSSPWKRSDQGPYAPCSNWSERHAAFAAGLGTFGLCDGLITAVGKAVRIGSVIAKLRLQPSKRPYIDRHAYCLHYTHDTCRACIPRCPVKALSEKGHDKKRCMAYTEKAMNSYIKKTYGLDTYACGLCQAEVPCTYKIPTLEDL